MSCTHEITYRYEVKYARTHCANCGKVVKKPTGYNLPTDYIKFRDRVIDNASYKYARDWDELLFTGKAKRA